MRSTVWMTVGLWGVALVAVASSASATPTLPGAREDKRAAQVCFRTRAVVSPPARVAACGAVIVGGGPSDRIKRALVARANAFLAQGDNARAIADFSGAIEIDPQDPGPFADRALLRDNGGDHAGAAEDATRAIILRPSLAAAYSTRGNARDALGDRLGALADYDKAIALDPSFGLVFFNRGVVRGALGQDDLATADYAEAIRLMPANASPLVNRAVIRMRHGQLEAALADLDAAIKLKPDMAILDRGLILDVLGKGEEARRAIDRALALQPDLAAGYCARAKLRRKMNDPAGADEDLARAAKIDPGGCG